MPKINNGDIVLVTIDNIHEKVPLFIDENKIMINSYEDMTDTILQMIQAKHLFTVDRDLLRSVMEYLTFMYCPGDDINKERVMYQLDVTSDEEDDEDDGDEGDNAIVPKINTLVVGSDNE